MEKKIPFSVSMCVWGGDNPVWFREALESLLASTLLPDEIVVAVDGPVPAALDEVIAEYEKNPCFRFVRLPENRGHGEARRASLAACQNDLVAVMDADDICHPERFAKQIPLFAGEGAPSVVGAQITEFIGTPDNIVARRAVMESDADIKQDMKKRCPVNMMTVVFRKSDVEAVGGFVDWHCEEDYYLWLRMAQAGMRFANLPDALVNARVGEGMYSRRGGKRYYESEKKLQKWMLQNKIIGYGRYQINLAKRFVVQRLLPNRLRGWVFRHFARKKA
jgi:glycosyltransferase involved in cell wall biosynthesis